MTTTTLNTADLTGAALDWAVAKVVGKVWFNQDGEFGAATGWLYSLPTKFGDTVWGKINKYSPSTCWQDGGPLIERYSVEIGKESQSGPFIATTQNIVYAIEIGGIGRQEGPTHLIAAMRAIVAAELGDTVDVPVELVK